ncbi:MAG: hypothetical protein M1838_005736 [Thelocarpon superellum]|nr:MAG: hypothetical protein M1838_005736 [Thelocarpon superellum]
MADSPSYIDYESFLDPSFSSSSFANSLVLATNNPSDTPLDLSTPLSRVLFDVQEVDTHIHTLTTKSAVPLLTHTRQGTEASARIVKEVESQLSRVTDGYQRLEKDVVRRWETAEQVRLVADRLLQTVKIGRAVTRCLTLGRQLEAQMAEIGGGTAGSAVSLNKREDHRAMVRASNTLLGLRQIFAESGPGQEGEGLDRVNAVTRLKTELVTPSEHAISSKAQQIVREFSMTSASPSTSNPPQAGSATSSMSASTYAQTEATKARTASALSSLYLLSDSSSTPFHPSLMIAALNLYIQAALTSSLAALTRALSTLPALDRTLAEISARCQNIVALEALLKSTKPPLHPALPSITITTIPSPAQAATSADLLDPLLQHFDTTSLASYFWRSLASSLVPHVQDIVARGGVSARTLRSQKDRVLALPLLPLVMVVAVAVVAEMAAGMGTGTEW